LMQISGMPIKPLTILKRQSITLTLLISINP